MMQDQVDPQLVADMMGMDPEGDPRMKSLNRQGALVNKLRGSGPPQGQMVGKHYVAPSALSHVANLGTQVMGGMADRKIDQGMADIGKEQAGVRTKYANAMMGALRRNKPPLAGEAGDIGRQRAGFAPPDATEAF